jgi:subtilisin family serine protease
VVIVASAGNREENQPTVPWPAAYPGVIAVSATDRDGTLWSGSTTGPGVALSAPGVDIETLANHQPDGRPGGYLHVAAGTSASAPIVAGAAALVRARFPRLHAADVVNRLIRTADDAGPPGRDPQYGFGRLNLLRALTADVPSVSANPLDGSASEASSAAAPGGSSSARPSRGLLVAGAATVGGLVLVAMLVVGLLVHSRRRNRRAH